MIQSMGKSKPDKTYQMRELKASMHLVMDLLHRVAGNFLKAWLVIHLGLKSAKSQQIIKPQEEWRKQKKKLQIRMTIRHRTTNKMVLDSPQVCKRVVENLHG